MYENTLRQILSTDKHTRKCFYGVFARNELPRTFSKYPVCIIINTQNRTQPGEHWLALYIDINKKGTFFDSYGLPPAFYRLGSYVKSVTKTRTYNQKRIQGLSTYCGYYSVMFLLMASRRELSRFFEQFSENIYKNDSLIENLIINHRK